MVYGELVVRLRTLGATEEQLEELDDVPDADAAAVQLILRLAAGEAAAAAPASPAQPAAPAPVGIPDKYVAAQNQIRMGKAADSTHGIQVLIGLTDQALSQSLADPVAAIQREFAQSGGDEDKENLRCVLEGLKRPGWTSGQSLEALVAHPHARMAKLRRHHVLALRLYTTSSYCRVNDPLRSVPPQRPHPFASTAYFTDQVRTCGSAVQHSASRAALHVRTPEGPVERSSHAAFWSPCLQGIKLMRAVAASLPDAHTTRIFWRGMKDLGLTMEFLQQGGTEFACLSTSASKDVAVNFAVSELPLIFKFETNDFTSRGADIAFLSVYPNEQEALYPPLTYLRSVKVETEDVGGKAMLVATVQPVFM